MAKIFYTLHEASDRLGVSEDKIRQLASAGKLQAYHDRDKIMFRREQVDGMVDQSALSATSIPLQSSGDTDGLDRTGTGTGTAGLHDETAAGSTVGSSIQPAPGDSAASGINVFEAHEIDAVDPMAQTQVTEQIPGDSDLALESVGSGSGLLDLTRESDDTSLGAELLDEIYPDDSGAETRVAGLPGSSGALDAGEAAMGSGMEGTLAAPEAGMAYMGEAYDPVGSGMSTGFLLGAMISLIIALIVAIYAVAGVGNALTVSMAKDTNTVMMYAGIMLVVTIIFGVVGFFVGKMRL